MIGSGSANTSGIFPDYQRLDRSAHHPSRAGLFYPMNAMREVEPLRLCIAETPCQT
jgi:hypothetical protein